MEKIDIILPNRIGDTILSLPLVICLNQLTAKYQDMREILVLPPPPLLKIISSFKLCKTKRLNYFTKFQSFISPADKAFFMMTTSQNLGYFTKKSYGEVFPHKKLIKYDVNTQYLDFEYAKNNLPSELYDFLRNKYKLASCSIKAFGFCYDLGYTTNQIISTFDFDTDCINIHKELSNFNVKSLGNNYFVLCLEAAYGRKCDSDRRWEPENYFEIAENLYEKYKANAVFIGIDNTVTIPERPYFKDLRKKTTFPDTAKILLNSRGYIGNDTGPLHLANLMKKKSIGVYFRKDSTVDYTPIFADLNKIVLWPKSIDEILNLTDWLYV